METVSTSTNEHKLGIAFEWRILLPLWAFLLVWFGQFFLALAPNWADGTYYDYGYLAPPLAIMFFASRWAEMTKGFNQETIVNAFSKAIRSPIVWLPGLIAILLTALLRLMETVDSGWRAPLYIHWFLLWGTTGLLFIQALGINRSAPLIPVAIVTLLSVPLPSAIEFSLIHGLTAQVMETSVGLNRFMGFPLTMAGETIFANGIPLQVSEGCSGIRSFQSSIFAGFVIGEFLRNHWSLRILLILSSAAFAFVGNSARVVYLVRHAFRHGEENLQKLHDVSGYVSLSLTLAAIVALGLLIDKLQSRLQQEN